MGQELTWFVFVPGRLGISPGYHLVLEDSVSQGWERPTCTSPRRWAEVWLEQVLFSRGPTAERVTVNTQNPLSPSEGYDCLPPWLT